MSVLSTPAVADAIARFMNGAKPRLKPELLFEEIPGDSTDLVVPTRHGDVDVLAWAARPGNEWDGARLAIGGQSAGGGIAAGAARLAFELGTPNLALQVLH